MPAHKAHLHDVVDVLEGSDSDGPGAGVKRVNWVESFSQQMLASISDQIGDSIAAAEQISWRHRGRPLRELRELVDEGVVRSSGYFRAFRYDEQRYEAILTPLTLSKRRRDYAGKISGVGIYECASAVLKRSRRKPVVWTTLGSGVKTSYPKEEATAKLGLLRGALTLVNDALRANLSSHRIRLMWLRGRLRGQIQITERILAARL